MPFICPLCGAAWSDDRDTCETVFNAFLALEFSDPDYGRVHMLTVACYMIQHQQYSDEALPWIERQLRAYLQGEINIAEIRAQAGREVQQEKRTWKMRRQPGDRRLPAVKWSMNIMDVARGYENAESYNRLITEWARHTVAEMQPLLP